MSLEIKGSIVQICTPQRTPKKDGSGDFVQQIFVIQTEGQYPKKVAFLIKKDELLESFNKYNSEGQEVLVKFNAESREWNGKWYTDLIVWRVESAKNNTQQASAPVAPNTQNAYPPVVVPQAEGDKDSLPF